MMDLVPVLIDGVVVLNPASICTASHQHCRLCPELAVGVHNWLVENEMGYLLIDLQDEKDVCHDFLVELIQLRKRIRIPFLFTGMMSRPRAVLDSYAFTEYPVFVTPEEAIGYLQDHYPALLNPKLLASSLRFGEPISCSRSRSVRGEGGETNEEEMDE